MFLLNKPVAVKRSAFLCLRRGVSVVVNVSSDGTGFSLPTQRCFRRTRHCDDARRLFSAYAEVFPPLPAVMGNFLSFLCLRRGVSPLTTSAETLDDFSLPTQRCFFRPLHRRLLQGLFSAYAEVFPPQKRASSIFFSFLCLRRGVSDWGIGRVRRDWLFSAYAEVFPPPHGYRESPSPFLCLRRGVSCLTNVRFC